AQRKHLGIPQPRWCYEEIEGVRHHEDRNSSAEWAEEIGTDGPENGTRLQARCNGPQSQQHEYQNCAVQQKEPTNCVAAAEHSFEGWVDHGGSRRAERRTI